MLQTVGGSSKRGRVWSGATVLAIVALVALGTGAVATHDAEELSLPGLSEVRDDFFGSAIAVDGERAFVGAMKTQRDAWAGQGAVFAYGFDGEAWYQREMVTPPNESARGFGSSVAADGDTLLVGAEDAQVRGTRGGAVHEYTWNGNAWEYQTRISLGKVTEADQRFGASVALDGNVALIGAPQTEVSAQAEAGEVWMYEKQGDEWVRGERITLSPPQEEAHFGTSLALEEDVALVGAAQISGKISEQGIVYEYHYDNEWTREDFIQLDGAESSDEFGTSVDLDGDRTLVGARNRNVDGEPGAGAVYFYEREAGDWARQGDAITLKNPSGFDGLGTAAAFTGEGALLGASGVNVDQRSSGGAAYSFALEAGEWTREESHDIRGETRRDTHFGEAVASSGEHLLVASRGQNAAYAFAKTDAGAWVLEDKLSVDKSVGSVDLVDGTALVGVPSENAGGKALAGAAYVFVHDGFGAWNEQERIPNPDPQPFSNFGVTVSLGEDRALIGAEDADVDSQDRAGAAYVFERSSTGTWSQQARIANPTPAEAEAFGNALELHGDTAIVGAHNEEVVGHQQAGAAYVFADDGSGAWTQQARLVDPDPSEDTQFGEAVGLGDTWVVVGGPGEPVEGEAQAGAVHVFSQQGGWTHHADLANPQAAEEDRFGDTLAFDGSTLLVGAQAEVDGALNAGKAYAYADDGTGTWTLRDEVPHPRPEAGDEFGSALVLEDTTVLAGAPGHDVADRSDVGIGYLSTVDTLAASFTYDPASGIGPDDEVVFRDDSTGSVASREWSFGDGTTSTETSPQRSFAEGTHQVCLDVHDAAGHADEACQTLEVLGDGETSPPSDDDQSSGPSSPTDDDQSSDSSSPTEDEQSDDPPQPSIDQTETSPGDPVTFTADGADGDTTVSWDFGDGQTATGSSVTHTYDDPGTYTVTMTTEDETGQTKTQSLEVEVREGGLPWRWIGLVAGGVLLIGFIASRGGDDEKTPKGGPGQSAYGSTPDETASTSQSGDDESFCPDCGAGLPSDATFCSGCGSKVQG